MSQICDEFLDNAGAILIASFRTIKKPAQRRNSTKLFLQILGLTKHFVRFASPRICRGGIFGRHFKLAVSEATSSGVQGLIAARRNEAFGNNANANEPDMRLLCMDHC